MVHDFELELTSWNSKLRWSYRGWNLACNAWVSDYLNDPTKVTLYVSAEPFEGSVLVEPALDVTESKDYEDFLQWAEYPSIYFGEEVIEDTYWEEIADFLRVQCDIDAGDGFYVKLVGSCHVPR